MGQAKNRGPLEARIEAATQTQDHRIDALRNVLGIPQRVAFGGYLVKVDQTDDFLGSIDNGTYGFVGSPETALSFDAFDDAQELARAEQGEVVVALFDFGSKLIVANVPSEPEAGEPAQD